MRGKRFDSLQRAPPTKNDFFTPKWADISVQPTNSAELAVFPTSHIDRCPGRLFGC